MVVFQVFASLGGSSWPMLRHYPHSDLEVMGFLQVDTYTVPFGKDLTAKIHEGRNLDNAPVKHKPKVN